MSHIPDYATLLGQWLPAEWRVRDTQGELADLLEVYGGVLDALDATVEQRLYDSFPDLDPEGRHCQDWLLPYFAQLLDVRLVSPDPAGRRAELADGVAWRQRKGTRPALEAIAEAVGGFEVETQEGWRRVAITPRVDRPLLPESAYGELPIPADATAAQRARHPGLSAVTPDLRYCSRAVECDPDNPAAHSTRFGGEELPWRQANRHGVPCAPDGFQDVTHRTPDLRTPGPGRGHYHPRRLLLYCAPPQGLFPRETVSEQWTTLLPRLPAADEFEPEEWGESERYSCTLEKVRIEVGTSEWGGVLLPEVAVIGLGDRPVRLLGVTAPDQPLIYRFENLWLDNGITIGGGVVRLHGCTARRLVVTTGGEDAPVIEAHASLFKQLEAPDGLVRLEYVTVLENLLAKRLQASDCILLPPLRRNTVDSDVPEAGCIRFSRLFHIPPPPDPGNPELSNDPLWEDQGKRSALRCDRAGCSESEPLFWNDTFGQPGCGVLRPEAPESLRFGAEDGGEMGSCHELRLVLRQRAVLDKLKGFLPVGSEAVLAFDPSLACAPPTENEN